MKRSDELPKKNTSKKKKTRETHGLSPYNQTKGGGHHDLRPTPGTDRFAENALKKMMKTPEDLEAFREILELLDKDKALKLNMLEMRDYAMMEMVQQKYLRHIANIPEDELEKLEGNPNIQKMVQKIWDVKRQIRSDCAKRDSTGPDRGSLGKILDDVEGDYEIIEEDEEDGEGDTED